MSIQKRRDRYEVRWRNDGVHRSKSFRRKIDAVQFEQRLRSGQPEPVLHSGGSYHTIGGTFVYVARTAIGEVLYVGATKDLFGRMASHRRASPWWPQMRRLEWEEFASRAKAMHQEAALVERLRPPYNSVTRPEEDATP